MTNTVFANQGPEGLLTVAPGKGAASAIAFSTVYNSTLICPDGGSLVTLRNNIFLNEKAGAPANTVTGTQCAHYYDLIKPQAASPNGANNILGMDPRFVNAGAADFHLMLGSPAIDAADAAATQATDYDGTQRPQGVRRDIGAFEYKP